MGVEERGRGAAADDADLDSGGAEIVEDAAYEIGKLRQGVEAGFIHALDVARIEGDAGETQVGKLFDGLRELQERFARGHANASQSGVHFGEDADFHLCGARGVGELAGGERAVQRHGDLRAARHLREMFELGAADDGEGHQQVGGLGGQHDFGFGDFGHGQPRGAAGNLASGDAHRLVGLGVRPQAQAVLARVVRDAG